MTAATLLEQVRDDVWALTVPLPFGAQPASSFAYLLRDADGMLHVVDPGWHTDDNWAALQSAVTELGSAPSRVLSIVLTHLHGDHLGMAERLRSASGARVLMHRAEVDALAAQSSGTSTGDPRTAHADAARLDVWGVPREVRAELATVDLAPASAIVVADGAVGDGDRLDIPGFELTVMWTPGHTHGSICLRDDARMMMMTGDHVLPTMHPGVGLGGASATNPLDDYLHSLERVSVYAEHEVLPGHGHRFLGLPERAEQHAAHHRRRTDEVAAALAEQPDASIWQVASRLTWTDGWPQLHGRHLVSALAQTEMHRRLLADAG